MDTWPQPDAVPFTADVAVTGVGSLPIRDPERAVAFVAGHAPRLPFWPQLPIRGPAEGMVRQTLGVAHDLLESGRGGRLRVVAGARAELLDQLAGADPAIRPVEAAGFAPFLAALRRGDLPDARAVKGQLTGPLTLAWSLVDDEQPALSDPELMTAIAARVTARAAWQARVLSGHGLPAVVVVDEPVLGTAHADHPAITPLEAVPPNPLEAVPPNPLEAVPPNPLEAVLAAIGAEGAVAGVHSCAARGDLPALPSADLLSLDLHGRGNRLPPAAARHWRDGGLLAGGMVPTVADPADRPPPERLAAAWLAMASDTGDLAALARRTIVTATCGLAGLDEDVAAASFQLAAATAAMIDRLTVTAARRRPWRSPIWSARCGTSNTPSTSAQRPNPASSGES